VLLSLDPPDWLVAHSMVVAEVAAFIARAAAANGTRVDRATVEAAALLHDIDKALPGRTWRGLDHGRAGAAWLSEHGLGELAEAVQHHPVTRLTDDAVYHDWWAGASMEARIVAYADKRGLRRLVPMATRFGEWAQRYRDGGQRQGIGRQRAEALERQVCTAARLAPTHVRRLRWVARAMDGAT
jgi:putative nucleotidyltransferase with HDIG domain